MLEECFFCSKKIDPADYLIINPYLGCRVVTVSPDRQRLFCKVSTGHLERWPFESIADAVCQEPVTAHEKCFDRAMAFTLKRMPKEIQVLANSGKIPDYYSLPERKRELLRVVIAG